MNYLAHTLLSINHIDYQLANVSTDVLKGKTWSGANQKHVDGIAMHKIIDRFTDSHPDVMRAKMRLGHGYLRGIVTDITFDYFVTRHWQDFVRLPFETFVSQFYQQASLAADRLAPAGTTFVRRLVKYDFFHLYGDIEGLAKVFEKFDLRLSPQLLKKETSRQYLPLIKANLVELETDFMRFFPQLVACFLQHSKADVGAHYFNGFLINQALLSE